MEKSKVINVEVMASKEGKKWLKNEEKKTEKAESSLKKISAKEAESLKNSHINRQTTIDHKSKIDIQLIQSLRDDPILSEK